MSSIPTDSIASIVDKIASACNLSECKYTVVQFDSIGQNFFGLLSPVTLQGKCDGKAVTIELVVKLAPTDERYRVSGAVTLFFEREIYVYTKLLEKYRQLQEHFPPNLQHLMPKCYFVCKDYCSEAIAMENMCAFGYEPFTNFKSLDYDHTVTCLKALAKFHALSFILKEKDPKMFDEVAKVCVPFTQETNNRFMVILLDRLQKAIGKFESNSRYLGLIEHLRDNCKEYVEAAAIKVKQKCICHGDIWKENVLFKYGEDHTPKQACLIDYQTVRISSAAFDTLFLITTSTNKTMRGNAKEGYQSLLDTYYETFSSVLKLAGIDPEKVYSKTMFEDDLKTVAPCCFIIANTALWLSSGLQEEGHVRSKQVFTSSLEREKAIEVYKQKLMDLVEDYISYGYFLPLEPRLTNCGPVPLLVRPATK